DTTACLLWSCGELGLMTEAAKEEILRLVVQDSEYGLWQPVIGNTTENLREVLLPNDMAAADQVVREAYRIVAQCTPPTGRTSSRIGLVCGYVQSGKTASMTAVSALAK